MKTTWPLRGPITDVAALLRAPVFPALAVVLIVAAGTMVWVGYRASQEWRRSTVLLVERDMDEVLTLLSTAVTRDMRGAQAALLPVGYDQLAGDPPHDMADVAASVLARFPYSESLFLWRQQAHNASAYAFNRSDRPPPWAGSAVLQVPFPVVTVADPEPMRPIITAVLRDADGSRRFTAFETVVAGHRYQVVARFLYALPTGGRLLAAIGLVVNLQWVEREYFAELVGQVAGIGNGAGGLCLSILDERGRVVAETRAGAARGQTRTRPFPFLFFDPSLLSSFASPERLHVRTWLSRVGVADDKILAAATTGSKRTLFLLDVAAVVFVGALLLSVRAVYTVAAVTKMKSDFISTLAHELKTPLAGIQLASQTLVSGRYSTPEAVPKYAALLQRETVRLLRLVDNLLAFARMNDVRAVYSYELLHLGDLVEDALEAFDGQVADSKADLRVDVPSDLPPLSADRSAMLRVLENVIDNALRYSEGVPRLSIVARQTDCEIHVWISDAGTGIGPDEIASVFDKFSRGRNARSGGSGLGLAIARQIVRDHGGRLTLRSELGSGTQVFIGLPCADKFASGEEQSNAEEGARC